MKNYYPFPLWAFVVSIVIAMFYTGLILSVKYSEQIEGFFNWLFFSKASGIFCIAGIVMLFFITYQIVKQRAK